MGFLGWRWWDGNVPPVQLLGLSILFLLPVIEPGLFGWLSGFLAIPVFYSLQVNGYTTGVAIIRLCLLLVAVTSLFLQRLDIYLFTLTLLPLGFVLHASAQNGDNAAVSGCKGMLALGLGWLVFWTGFGVLADTNPYASLIKALDLGFQQTMELYSSKDAGLTPEVTYNLQIITNNLRETVPRLMPGLLATATIFTVWINMVLGNRFVARHQRAPWGSYDTWKLPDNLVWLPIAAIFAVLVGRGTVQDIGFCLLLVSGVVYLFQGLAVLLALLNRWRVPAFARLLLYGILLIQSYSLIFLALLGLCDVWVNLRQKANKR